MMRRGRPTPGFIEPCRRRLRLLAYIDTYWVLAVGAAIMFFLSFVLKKNDPHGGGAAAVG